MYYVCAPTHMATRCCICRYSLAYRSPANTCCVYLPPWVCFSVRTPCICTAVQLNVSLRPKSSHLSVLSVCIEHNLQSQQCVNCTSLCRLLLETEEQALPKRLQLDVKGLFCALCSCQMWQCKNIINYRLKKIYTNFTHGSVVICSNSSALDMSNELRC